MKRLKLTTASTAFSAALLACGLLLSCCVPGAVCKSRGHFSGVGFDFSTGGYHDVAVIVSPELNRAECPQILDDIKAGMREASRSLSAFLEGKAHFATANIQVPADWTAADCQTPLEHNKPIRSEDGDIFVSPDHPIHSGAPWTQQSQGCGRPGDLVYLPRSFVGNPGQSGEKKGEERGSISGDNGNQSTANQKAKAKAEAMNNATAMGIGDEIRDQWLRYRFGVFDEARYSPSDVGSEQHSLCYGKSVIDVVAAHPDIQGSRAKTASATSGRRKKNRKTNLELCRFTVSSAQPPRFVIALENSKAMDTRGHWELIMRSVRKMVQHDLPADAHLGLVLFNDGAHVAHPVVSLEAKQNRHSVIVHVKNKFNLTPKDGSCVRCGVMKALEALNDAGAGIGGTVIVVSQGKTTSLALNEEKELTDLAAKHRLKIFSVAIPRQPQDDISLSLERLAHSTGGESFFVAETAYGREADLSTYVSLVDAFREIQSRTTGDGPYLIHEKSFDSHSHSGALEEAGSFVIDKYVGRDTAFDVFTMNKDHGFIKSITVQDRRGRQYREIVYEMAAYHIFSAYRVPFQEERNIGMNWTYALERMPSDDHENRHVVRVTSKPRKNDGSGAAANAGGKIDIRFFTNVDEHAIKVSPVNPIKLFAEVTLNSVPVMDARVTAELRALNQSGYLTPPIRVDLLDTGSGDPDLRANDGVYSRYLTNFSGGEGRYTVTLLVTDNQGRAFSFQRAEDAPFSRTSCCTDPSASAAGSIRNQKLGTFARVTSGDSFRIPEIRRRGEVAVAAAASSMMPPARILDLDVEVLTDSRQLEFSWTAPGEDFDQGKVTSYQLYSSTRPDVFYADLNSSVPVLGFNSARSAGERESYRVTVHEADYDRNVFYVLVAIDRDGNQGEPSNVRQAYVPSPENLMDYNDIDGGFANGPEHRVISGPSVDKPGKVLLYIVVGIVAFIVICVVLVLIIVISYRKKKHLSSSQTDLSSNSIGVNASSAANRGIGMDPPLNGKGISGVSEDFASPGYAVCDEQELNEETNGFLATYSDFTSSNVGDYNNTTGSNSHNNNGGVNYSAADGGGNVLDATYGWTEYNNPYVNAQLPVGNTLPTYRDFNHPGTLTTQNNGFVPNFYGNNSPVSTNPNATYARPVPKSQRMLYGSGNILNSTPQSPGTTMTTSSSNNASSSHHNLYRQRLDFIGGGQNVTAPAAVGSSAPMSNSNSSSGDERVPSISPPPLMASEATAAASEQMRLISSLSNTPTKSILKKPKHAAERHNNLARTEDLSSQSSKDERLSESSNVSSSDRDTPPNNNANRGIGIDPPLNANDIVVEAVEAAAPDFSPSNTYLETSFDVPGAEKVPPPTLPKPKLDESSAADGTNTLERRIRNITQV